MVDLLQIARGRMFDGDDGREVKSEREKDLSRLGRGRMATFKPLVACSSRTCERR